ncbi:MAG: hypothetical protein RJA61_666 [Candidatus Parcubacteria bacterium]|jgi:disulfide bond formation protein DsbB
MQTLASDVTLIFSILSIVAQVISGFLLLALIFRKTWGKNIILIVGKRAIIFIFLIALFATVGSLLYSDVVGYEPCKLCWFQRIFMYPQVILLPLALWRKETSIVAYSFALSLAGGLIAFYHYLLQRGIVETAPCSAVGYGANCSDIFVMSYGYITIPLMALSAFILMTLIATIRFVYNRS